jgi:hypothetical protein
VTGVGVTIESADPSGLAQMIAGLLEQQLAREPARAALLRPSVVELSVPDAAVAVTVRLAPDGVRIADGPAPDAHLRIVAASDRMLALAAAPLRGGIPDPLHPDGRAAIADLMTRRVRVHGLLRHPRRLTRFTSLISVHERASRRSFPWAARRR